MKNRKGILIEQMAKGTSSLMFVVGILCSAASYASLDGIPVDKQSYQNVVAILEEDEVIGSGTLTEKNKMITAGHCVLDEVSVSFHSGRLSGVLSNLEEGFFKNQNRLLSYIESLPTMQAKRKELGRYFDAIVESRKKILKIYFGMGSPGGKLQGEDIIDRVVIHESWIAVLKYRFLKSFRVLKEEEIRTREEEENDFTKAVDLAEIYLIKDIDTEKIEIIPSFTVEEYRAYHFTGNETVRLVGFGQTATFGATDYLESFGLKNQLDVSLNGSLGNSEYNFKVVGKNGKSAGESDSGGAAFVQLRDGSWRFLGVIIATGPQVGADYLFSVNNNSVMGTTLVYIKTE